MRLVSQTPTQTSGVAKAGPGRAHARPKVPCLSHSCHTISREQLAYSKCPANTNDLATPLPQTRSSNLPPLTAHNMCRIANDVFEDLPHFYIMTLCSLFHFCSNLASFFTVAFLLVKFCALAACSPPGSVCLCLNSSWGTVMLVISKTNKFTASTKNSNTYAHVA